MMFCMCYVVPRKSSGRSPLHQSTYSTDYGLFSDVQYTASFITAIFAPNIILFFSLHWFTRQVARTCGGPQLYSHAEGGDDYLCKLGSHHSWNDTIVTILLSRHYRWIYILSFVSVHSIEQQTTKTDECETVQIVQGSNPEKRRSFIAPEHMFDRPYRALSNYHLAPIDTFQHQRLSLYCTNSQKGTQSRID